MNNTFTYSVAIRTLGNTGEKYVRTIQSVLWQTIQPEEIIVVIPNGYDLDYVCGKEKIIRSQKGMVTQRAVGIQSIQSDYALIIDDDVELEREFVKKSYDYLVNNNLDCVLPGKRNQPFTFSKVTRIKGAIRGLLFTSKSESDWQDVIVKTSGHKVYVNSYNPHKCYLCQTGCFQAFFMKTNAAKAVHFEDELWLEQGTISRYAIIDDATFFYKSYLMGCRIAYSFAQHIHLDAAVGRASKSKLEERRIRHYTDMKNHYIFWRKFIYDYADIDLYRFTSRLCWWYFLCGYSLYTIAINCLPWNWSAIKAMFGGYSDGKRLYRGEKLL